MRGHSDIAVGSGPVFSPVAVGGSHHVPSGAGACRLPGGGSYNDGTRGDGTRGDGTRNDGTRNDGFTGSIGNPGTEREW